MKINLKYSLMLMLAAIIWGAAFVAQSAGMDYIGPVTFNCIRSFFGSLVLIPIAAFMDKKEGVLTPWKSKELVLAGLVCGIILFFATTTQQIGLVSTSPGKAGFITALYIVLVPVFSLALRKKPGKFIWLSVILAVIGLYFLCLSGTTTLEKGDIWELACAILFACHILVIDKFAPHVDVLKLSSYQFAVCGALSIIPMILEKPEFSCIWDCRIPILYAGVMSGGIAYTLQMEAQKRVAPTVACILMSLESVFSVVFGFLIMKDKLTARELIGCGIMFVAVILAQLAPSKNIENISEREVEKKSKIA